MPIARRPLASNMLIVCNSRFLFGRRPPSVSGLRIVRSFQCADIATVYLAEFGVIGLAFANTGPLASIEVLNSGEGEVPDAVMQNHDTVRQLQADRVAFGNFVAASLFGRISARRHRPLEGALYTGLDSIMAFGLSHGSIALPMQEADRFEALVREKVGLIRAGKDAHYWINEDDLDDAIAFMRRLMARATEFEYADLQSCVTMNYQAAILHNRQHAAASLALNMAVAESLVKEIFLSYGLVQGRTAKPFATKPPIIPPISNGAFKDMKLGDQIKLLYQGALIDNFLYQRFDAARARRNALMHRGERITPVESGDFQTVVRDLWALLIETPFELNEGWAYRY